MIVMVPKVIRTVMLTSTMELDTLLDFCQYAMCRFPGLF